MDWVARSISALDRAMPDAEPPDSSTEASGSKGGGVKEDFSELAMSFSKHLRGVASFLAPPNALPGDRIHAFPKENKNESENKDENEDPSSSSSLLLSAPLLSLDLSGDGDNSTPRGRQRGDTSSLPSSSVFFTSSSLSDRHKLAGLRSDLAELKGSMATGLSQIIRVVREEIEKEEFGRETRRQGKKGCRREDREGEGEEEEEEEGRDNNNNSAPLMFDSFNPLYANLLYFENDITQEEEEEEEEEEETRKRMERFDFDENEDDPASPVDSNSSSSRLLQAVGVTEEVLAFARDISRHPETWIDFPSLSDEDDNDDEFDMSDAQKDHVRAVEYAIPRLAALRIELCPMYMTEGWFWKVYFVLLHSRLNKHDAQLLTTSQIEKVRVLLREMQRQDSRGVSEVSRPFEEEIWNPKSHMGNVNEEYNASSSTSSFIKDFRRIVTIQGVTLDSSFHPDFADEVHNKCVLPSTVKFAPQTGDNKKENDDSYNYNDAENDEWPDEDPSPNGACGTQFRNEEDISFSDLEDNDDDDDNAILYSKVGISSQVEIQLDLDPPSSLKGSSLKKTTLF